MCAGMAMPAPPEADFIATLVSNLAIALIPLLYGLILKYFFALPWAHSIKED